MRDGAFDIPSRLRQAVAGISDFLLNTKLISKKALVCNTKEFVKPLLINTCWHLVFPFRKCKYCRSNMLFT